MLPSDMNLSIRSGTVGYIIKILVSDGNFILEKNYYVNTLDMVKSHKVVLQLTITHKNLILLLAGGFTIWNVFQ